MSKSTPLNVTLFGAARTVTGSKYHIAGRDLQLLVDCGMFQGRKELRERNWAAIPRPVREAQAVFLTHAHLDHSGFLPVLAAAGFRGPVFCTRATRDLCEVLLLDAAKLQEEEARYLNQRHLSKHHPALPLFDAEAAQRALRQMEVVDFGETMSFKGARCTFHGNGHILGSAWLDLEVDGRHLLFSGDLGRPHHLILNSPEPPAYADYVFVESTYGDRRHDPVDGFDELAQLVNDTSARGGSVLIPSFAVGRAQTMLYMLSRLRDEQRIPQLPIYLDSPMAIDATELMCRHHRLHKLTRGDCQRIFRDIHFLRTTEQSMTLNDIHVPVIIVSASGMATGGRVLYHLKRMLGNYRNTVAFAGYQAKGTRGDRLVSGETSVKIHGQFYDVKAQIANLDYLSAHADGDEIIQWLRGMPAAPKRCFIAHGEPEAAAGLEAMIEKELGWPAYVPEYAETLEL